MSRSRRCHDKSMTLSNVQRRNLAATHPLSSSIGHKAGVALSGLGLGLWTLLHTAGVLGVFAGPELMNGYARALRETPIPWLQRTGFSVLLFTHALLVGRLWWRTRRARSMRYQVRRTHVARSLASRTMRWSGAMLGAWLGYHVLHIYGPAHPHYVAGDVHHNLVAGLASWPVALSYAVASLLLTLHLWHGARSALHSLGLDSTARRWSLGLVGIFLALVTLGLLAPPLAALFGYWRAG